MNLRTCVIEFLRLNKFYSSLRAYLSDARGSENMQKTNDIILEFR